MLPNPDNQQFYPLILSQKLSIMAILLSKPRNFSLFLLCISSQVFSYSMALVLMDSPLVIHNNQWLFKSDLFPPK